MSGHSTTRILPVMAFIVLALGTAERAQAQLRVWHDVRGGSVRGRFAGMNEYRAVIHANGRAIEVPFWNLMPEDQRFIAHRFTDPESVPSLTDVPRDWTLTDGTTLRGQLLRVEPDSVTLVVNAVERSVSRRQLSPVDREYVSSWKGAMAPARRRVAPSSKDNGELRYGPLTFREPKNDRMHLLTSRIAQVIGATIVLIGGLLWRFSVER